MDSKHDCEMCRKTWELYGETPKCEECIPIELNPENVKAYQVYALSRGQLITRGMDGSVIDVSIPAIETVMQWLKVPKKKRGDIGMKVLMLARHNIKLAREKQELERGNNIG